MFAVSLEYSQGGLARLVKHTYGWKMRLVRLYLLYLTRSFWYCHKVITSHHASREKWLLSSKRW